MKTFLLGGFISLTLMAYGAIAYAASATKYDAKVVSVIDGDTINVMHNGAKEKVILFGVDCPENGQDFGDVAKKFTDDRCYKQTVTVESKGQDPHGRTIAVVTLADGTNLNQELVKQGLAWWSDKFAPNETTLKKLFLAAKAAHTGLWSAPDPVPPWIFRNGSRSTQAVIVK
jgi:endonuclease YncB( thermonuclease family)